MVPAPASCRGSRSRSSAGRHVHPAHPRLDAGRTRRGLHPHGAVQGHPREPGDRPARAPRSAMTPVVTQFGIDLGGPDRRRGRHRDRVQPARPRQDRRSTRSTSRTCRSSSASCSSPRPRSWWRTSSSTSCTPSSTRASACTELRPPGQRDPVRAWPRWAFCGDACQTGEVHPSPAPAPALDGHDRQTTLQVLAPRLRARGGRLLHRVAEPHPSGRQEGRCRAQRGADQAQRCPDRPARLSSASSRGSWRT